MDRASAQTRTTRARQLANEHFVIRQVMARIENQLARTEAEPSNGSLHWDLFALVCSFRDSLRRHFALEEAGGLLGDASQYYAERLRRTAQELVAQHRGFERRIERIRNQLDLGVHDAELPPAAVAESYRAELRQLLADLSVHERSENKLLHEALLGTSEAG